MFIRVLLPAPFSPSRAWISPGRTVKSTASFARTPGKALTMPRASSAGTPTASVIRSRGTWMMPAGCRSRASVPSGARELGERDGDAVCPPVHARLALVTRRTRRELVEVGLDELPAGRDDLLAGVVLDRAGEDVESPPLASQCLGERVLDPLDVRGRKVGDALLRGLAVHEAVQAHRLGVGVEVLVTGG